MKITVREMVETQMEVPAPFASKTSYGIYHIVDRHCTVTKIGIGMIFRTEPGDSGHERLIGEAINAEHCPMREAEAKLSEILASFQVSNPSIINSEKAVEPYCQTP